MLKKKIGSLVLVMGVAACLCSCGSSSSGASSTGGTSGASGGASGATGGASGATGGVSGSGGRGGSTGTGGASASGGRSGGGGTTGTVTTLAAACAKNCVIGAALPTCSTTMAVCEQSCVKTQENTAAVNADLGRRYTEMMICIANDPRFATQAGYMCAKPDRALNKWSPEGGSTCEEMICGWHCEDGTTGNFDPFVDIRCACSSV